MALQKGVQTINFSSGVETKTDPNQLQIGRFSSLVNSVFDKLGRLTKRNGFEQLPSLPTTNYKFLTTFNGNLSALGKNIAAYSTGQAAWVTKGNFEPLNLSVMPLIRNSTNQSTVDTAVSPNGLICTTYTDEISSASTTVSSYRYAIADSSTGQNIILPTVITSTIGTVTECARVFTLGNYFILVFGAYNGSSYQLQYKPINAYVPTVAGTSTSITTSYTPSTVGKAFDGVVVQDTLYLSWNGASSSGVKAASLNSNLSASSAVVISSNAATNISVCSDLSQTTPNIWTSLYSTATGNGYVAATNNQLSTLFSSRPFVSSGSFNILNMAPIADSGALNLFTEVSNYYSYGSVSNYIAKYSVNSTGSASAQSIILRSVGLASKSFFIGSSSYFMTAYQSPYQPTYFLSDSSGNVLAKVAYGNGGGYITKNLPSVYVLGDSAQVGYLIKDSVQAVNKDTNVSAGTQVAGIFTQTGINICKFNFNANNLSVAETANNLNISGGFLWNYDGYTLNENNFLLYPDNVYAAQQVTGSMSAQNYYYVSTYEWSDNQGNIYKSGPSIPFNITVDSSCGSAYIYVPTLRLTHKKENSPKIVIYRWSAAQQNYYQVTKIQSPVISSTNYDSVRYTDEYSDDAILGNNLLYTTGDVLENNNGPSANALTLFDDRLFMISSEDPNLLRYSKQVIQNTPVEMSDLLTLYVPPTTSTGISTGPMKCLAPMDDKLIILKKNALYYMNGSGPDNTGANSQFSQPVFITSTVGCENQNSIVMTPNGLMFQSDKGIWLLGRDLSTKYIGAPVEEYNSSKVVSALAIPATNQVRFTLDSGETLMYDYFVDQWGTFEGIPGISSTIYENLHSFINKYGETYQETQGKYLDGSSPVLMSFTTGWLNFAGLQGYQRVYRFYLLGDYKTPHRLTMGAAYDFDPVVTQFASFVPDNYSAPWGVGSTWGSISLWGGNSSKEQWQFNFERQQCQSVQVSFNEYYDSTVGAASGAGLTLSAMDFVVGSKKGYPRNLGAKNKVG